MIGLKISQVWWCVPLVATVWLLVLDFVPSGRLEIAYDFHQESPFISRLSPDGRVLAITQNDENEYYQQLVIDPVYFDVRLPQAFERVRANIWYNKKPEIPLRIGYQTTGGWSWKMTEIIPVEQQGNWTLGESVLPLADAEYKDRVLRFIISSPELSESGQVIDLHRIEMEFKKEAWSRKNAYQRIKEYARTWVR